MAHKIRPVILAGGSGERLWPLSKIDYPKQFVSINGTNDEGSGLSLFQESLLRVSEPSVFGAPIILCNEEHRFIVTEQLRHIGIINVTIIIEPIARNTAPAVALAALHMEHEQEAGVMMVMPSDHKIDNPAAFIAAVKAGRQAAEDSWLITFGVKPDAPETGYGYIQQGQPLEGHPGVYRISRFVEKPDRTTAETYLAEGNYAWNSGMFLMHSHQWLTELSVHEPQMLIACGESYRKYTVDQSFIRLDKESMQACPSNSIDYAVMERTQKGAVIPVDMQWCDLGSWTALCNISSKDANNNAVHGRAVMADTTDCYIHTHHDLVATIGISNMVVVSADNAVLIGPKDRMQDIKQLVKTMRDQQMADIMLTSFSHRPWGSFYSIDRGDRYQVKRLHLKPGGKISLQTHEKRSEHWIVVRGRATVTNGDNVFTLEENQSTYIPAGQMHRLENRHDEELIVVEVQTGAYLGEDDIKRYEDVYNRNAAKDQA
jgi:mannose-1-phosphate guanylyltransferase/mannose-6-phosphate isomerase